MCCNGRHYFAAIDHILEKPVRWESRCSVASWKDVGANAFSYSLLGDHITRRMLVCSPMALQQLCSIDEVSSDLPFPSWNISTTAASYKLEPTVTKPLSTVSPMQHHQVCFILCLAKAAVNLLYIEQYLRLELHSFELQVRRQLCRHDD
jgi:hypothetical protein